MTVIKVGIPVSLTGQFQTQGRQALVGLQAWADGVNRTSGLEIGTRRYEIEVIHYDDSSLADGAATAANRLIHEDQIDLLFGPYSSGLAGAVSEVAAGAGMVLWNQGGAADIICQPGRWVVGILTGAREYLAGLPELVKVAHPSAASLCVLRCADGAFPRLVSEGLERSAQDRGFRRVCYLEFPSTQNDFSELISEALAAKPDLLLVVGRIRHDIAIAQMLASQPDIERRPSVTAVVATPIERFRREMGENVEGFVGPSQWEPPRDDAVFLPPVDYYGPTPAQVQSELNLAGNVAGVPVDYPMAQSFAAGLIAQRCLKEAGSLDQGLLWRAAGNLDFHTFFGRFKIYPESGRQTGRSVNLVQWQRGKKVVIWPPEQAQGKLESHQQSPGE